MKKHQYKNIYFLRFIFILMIVFCHIFSGVPNPVFNFIATHHQGGGLAVEFFFILSGFFFAYTLDLNLSAFEYIKKRVLRLYPVLAFYVLGCFFCDILNVQVAQGEEYGRIFQLLLLDGIGLNNGLDYGVSWFVSALLFSSLFLFCLYKSVSKKIADLLLGIIVLLSYVILLNLGNIYDAHHIVWHNILPLSLVRAVSGMGLGIFLFYTYSHFNLNTAKQKPSILYGLLEIFLFGYCIYTMIYHNYYSEGLTIVLFWLLLYVFLMNKGFFSRLLENNFSVILGRYSYSIYLTHMFALTIIMVAYTTIDDGYFVLNYPLSAIFVLYLLVILLGILTYHFIEKPNNALYKKLGFYYYFAVFGGILVLFTTAYISYSLAR